MSVCWIKFLLCPTEVAYSFCSNEQIQWFVELLSQNLWTWHFAGGFGCSALMGRCLQVWLFDLKIPFLVRPSGVCWMWVWLLFFLCIRKLPKCLTLFLLVYSLLSLCRLHIWRIGLLLLLALRILAWNWKLPTGIAWGLVWAFYAWASDCRS